MALEGSSHSLHPPDLPRFVSRHRPALGLNGNRIGARREGAKAVAKLCDSLKRRNETLHSLLLGDNHLKVINLSLLMVFLGGGGQGGGLQVWFRL